MSKTLSDFITYKDAKLERKYAKKKIPINELLEGYIEGKIDFHGDVYEMLSHRENLTDEGFSSAFWSQFGFIFNRLLPEVVLHTKSQDKRIVREHYNRGNDFFEFFLGHRMVYTSGFYLDGDLELP